MTVFVKILCGKLIVSGAVKLCFHHLSSNVNLRLLSILKNEVLGCGLYCLSQRSFCMALVSFHISVELTHLRLVDSYILTNWEYRTAILGVSG